tara:strand:+ start:51 stop:251 length:201 start_codon:yes stop_codon:yes gene_type:complete
MNQKDYKEISGIIYPYANTPLIRATIKGLSNRLADYFEREDIVKFDNDAKKCLFDKKQFLKDCGLQ